MSSAVDICNLALAGLGVEDQIVSLTQDSTNARMCNLFYEHTRDDELRAHPWNFAIKRAQLAETTSPDFGKAAAYVLPADFLRLLPADPFSNSTAIDYQIEGLGDTRVIVTDTESLIEIRYIAKVEDTNLFDPCFREALIGKLRIQLCEKITGGSNSKMQIQMERYKQSIRDAKKANAFDNPPQEAPESSWLTCRF